MARKSEVGIDYFPMNTDIIEHKKFKLTVADNGVGVWDVAIRLLCKIYKEKGYWFDWEDVDARIMLAEESKHPFEYVEKVVLSLVKREFFETKLFDQYGILTSDRIQDNYFIAKKRVKAFTVVREFLLLEQNVIKEFQNVDIIPVSADMIHKNANISTQNKKEKEKSEEEGESAKGAKFTQEERDGFKKFMEWIDKNAHRVNTMKEKFTIEEYLKLIKKLSGEFTRKLLISMHNYKPLTTKNISSYLTILNWSKKEVDPGKVAGSVNSKPSLSETVKAIEEQNGSKK